jgi:Bacteriophage clamp loader A subunit
MSTPSLSEYLTSINQTKKNVILDNESEKAYPPFIINKCLAAFHDTILFSNEMNMYPHLDKKMQYDFLINSINPRKRFSPWERKALIDNLEVVKEYYGYNTDKALQALRILSKDQLEDIKRLLNKGGKR